MAAKTPEMEYHSRETTIPAKALLNHLQAVPARLDFVVAHDARLRLRPAVATTDGQLRMARHIAFGMPGSGKNRYGLDAPLTTPIQHPLEEIPLHIRMHPLDVLRKFVTGIGQIVPHEVDEQGIGAQADKVLNSLPPHVQVPGTGPFRAQMRWCFKVAQSEEEIVAIVFQRHHLPCPPELTSRQSRLAHLASGRA